jgi:glycosyltransferase involved in cell wall biosynthesis
MPAAGHKPHLLVIEPTCTLSSPSMKGFMKALPVISQHFTVEFWATEVDEGAAGHRVVLFPKWLCLPIIGTYLYGFCALALNVYRHLLGQPRPDLIYAVAWGYPAPDVWHVHFSAWDWDKRLRKLGLKDHRDLYYWLTNWLSKSFATLYMQIWPARHYLSVSRSVADDLLRARSDLPVRVLPNSYDPSRFHSGVRGLHRTTARRDLGYTEEDVVFIFASLGHYRRKGLDLATRAMALLHERQPSAKMLLVGGSPANLTRLRRQLDLEAPSWPQWLSFTGMVSDIERYYAAADGLLFPSHSEAFSLVEVETGACGLPLFLTRHHGSEMIMEAGKNGLWLEFDPVNIADVLETYVTKQWQPTPVPLKHAMDSDAYAQRLTQELLLALP